MTTHLLSFTYKPKIDAVFSGECTQTIRKVRKRQIKPGDRLLIHTWTGKPRYSRWGQRITVGVTEVIYITVLDWGVLEGTVAHSWLYRGDPLLLELAERDHIDPPTPEVLRDVLKTLNAPEWTGEYNVIRWKTNEQEDRKA